MPVKKNHYAEFPDDPNELSESVRLQVAHDDYLDHNTSKKNPFENARESMGLHTKPFEIESMEQNQRNKMQRQDSVY